MLSNIYKKKLWQMGLTKLLRQFNLPFLIKKNPIKMLFAALWYNFLLFLKYVINIVSIISATYHHAFVMFNQWVIFFSNYLHVEMLKKNYKIHWKVLTTNCPMGLLVIAIKLSYKSFYYFSFFLSFRLLKWYWPRYTRLEAFVWQKHRA